MMNNNLPSVESYEGSQANSPAILVLGIDKAPSEAYTSKSGNFREKFVPCAWAVRLHITVYIRNF